MLALIGAGAVQAAPGLVLDVVLDPESRRLEVEAELRPAQRDFEFVLHEALQPQDASIDGRTVRVRPAGRRDAWRAWRVEVPQGATLKLRYAGTLPALERERDHRGVLQGMPPMASPEGSYLPAGAGWYPRPAALFSYRVSLSVKGGQRALVAGRLEDESLPATPADPYRARFAFDQPTDGIDLMAGPWVVRERRVVQADGRPLRLRTYFPAALDQVGGLADAYLADSEGYIERYGALIGAYPFTEFSVVASPLPTGFGMPTLTYIGEQVLRLPFIRATSLGHEILHNWWGNGVMVDYARGNWSEGLTTFMADYAYKEAESPAGAREMRLGWLRDFAAVPAGNHQALADFRSRTHGAAAAVGYGKAAMVFVMLRDAIGEDAFARGIRLFWERERFRVAGWAELQQAFEETSGRPLEGFFRQWLTLRGGPALRLERAQLLAAGASAGKSGAVVPQQPEVPGAERYRLRLELVQPQPAYALRVPLQLTAGERQETRWVDIDGEHAGVDLNVDFAPAEVRLDPDLRLWRLPDSAQLPPILRQWIVARAPRLVIADALPALGRAGDAGVIDAAGALARRLFERPPARSDATALGGGNEPVLLVGTHDAVSRVLQGAGLPAAAEAMPPGGEVRVWTARAGGGPPLAVVEAKDAAALQAIARPLPHYGSQSWLVFDGGRVLARGVWDAPGPAVAVER
ncbi:M1 family metallopeptidase [Thauera sp.]|uniref:M1 family metallopeptidase n=1 Tax=Thauera sp. TaxID=1905334 RepID=UPI002A367CA7|nr:M1 family aminopeptidase [Thauera sp.]MDX9884799.1 M1 family aminopeptidase [Thauera sp.]